MTMRQTRPAWTRDLPTLPPAWADQAERRLPRYTSYPTATAFTPLDDPARASLAALIARPRPGQPLSAYVHVPFCRRLCSYCGCNTSVFHVYTRVAAYHRRLLDEIDLWAGALGDHGGLSHLHLGGGSPNSLSPDDLVALVARLADRLGLRADAEIAIELDPGFMDAAFAQAAGAAGVTRASLGVQTLDPEVQAKINRIQGFDRVERAVSDLRAAGVTRINFDLMYGLPGQTPASTAATADQALRLAPDRLAVFGYAHVPWMKKHQRLIDEAELADAAGRWAQAEAIDAVLVAAGYVRIGLDHYARPDDPLTRTAARGGLRRNFQGYTDDEAAILVPIGPSAIGRFETGMAQNATALDAWGAAVAEGRLPLVRRLEVDAEDRLRAAVIERLMCDLRADVGDICRAHARPPGSLDAGLARAAALEPLGLCAVDGRLVTIPEPARRMMRAVAACFDAALSEAPARHARAV